MKYKVIVYYDNMPDSEHVFGNKNDAIFNTAYVVLNIAMHENIRLKWWK